MRAYKSKLCDRLTSGWRINRLSMYFKEYRRRRVCRVQEFSNKSCQTIVVHTCGDAISSYQNVVKSRATIVVRICEKYNRATFFSLLSKQTKTVLTKAQAA